VVNLQDRTVVFIACCWEVLVHIRGQRSNDAARDHGFCLPRDRVRGGGAANSFEEEELVREDIVGGLIVVVAAHIIFLAVFRQLSLDDQEVADGLNDSLCNVAKLCSQVSYEALEEIPAARADLDVVAVYKSNEVL
jgi:hypothetical protein